MTPSTLMGPGWRARTATHAADVLAGNGWRNYRTDNEIEQLRAVLLTWPGDELAFEGEPADWLMSERPDLPKMRLQAENIATYFESVGAKVHWIRPREAAPPNLVFACDLATMTPEGAIVSRMAAQQRAGEERFAALALAEAGVPLLGMPTGTATLEGADVMWLNHGLVLVGTGIRTNEAGFLYVRDVLATQGVHVRAVPLKRTVQHLLGSRQNGLLLWQRHSPPGLRSTRSHRHKRRIPRHLRRSYAGARAQLRQRGPEPHRHAGGVSAGAHPVGARGRSLR